MEYFGAYRFLFESPKWATLLLIGVVCQFVPIVGQFVLMGYLYWVIEAKLRHGPDQFPEFDFNQLGVYLVRGVWPFLVSLVAAIPLFVLMIPAFVVFVLSGAAIDQRGGGPPWFFIGLIFTGILVFILLSLALHILALPMILRAGLSQDFGSAFSMEFVRDFLGRVWKELLLAMLFLIVSAPFLMLGGFILLFVGIYPAAVLLVFTQQHFQYQLYQLYLKRGGTPIPLKEIPS